MASKDTISRAEMEAVIDAGGSVFHNGRLYTSKASLPSPGELAGVEGLKEEEAELERQLEETKRKRADAEKAAKAAAKAEADRQAAEEAEAKKSGSRKADEK